MALETSQLGLQLRNFAQLIAGNITSIEPFTKQPSVMQSLSSQFKALHTFEKRQECQLDAPTSGESSPCLSDSELPSRFAMPTLQEVSDILTDELSLEVDSTLEKLKEIDRRELTLIFEDLEPGFQKGWFYRYLKEVRYNNSPTDRYLTIKEMKTICFRGNNSIVVNFYVKKHDAIYDFFKTFQSYVRNETRRPIKIHRVIGDRRIRESWFAVVIRNLPPKVTQKEITDQCQRDLKDPITVGTLIKVKDRHCCLVRCEYLEDAEVICRKLNDFQLKDHQTYIKYVVKAHLHPHCTLKHLAIEKSPFSDFIKSSKGSKHGISELLHLFKSNKKPSSTYENIKPPPPPPIDKRRGPMEEEKMDSMPTNGMDYYNKRSYSDHSRNQNRTPNKMPLEPVMSQEPANFPRVNESAPQEGDAKGPSDENLNGQDGQKEDYGERKLEEEERNPDYKRGKNEGNKLSIRKDYGEKRYDKRHERSSSRHERRSSSRRRKHNYEKDDYSKRSSRYNQSKDYDRHKKHRSHKESRDRKRNHSRSRNSKSKSRSKSRSRSKERVKNHRHNDYKKGRNQSNFQKSPKRSNSSTRKRNASKNRSKSPSKSRSRSSHREKQKEEKSKNKTVNSYEYEHKDNQSENGRSPSPSKKNKKRRDSRSHSRDKSKRRNDNSPQKPYYNQNREHGNKYQDYQKNSYNRKDNRDTRGHHDYKTQKRNNYSSRNDYRDYDDKHRKRNRDHDKSHRARDRSHSKKSKSPDRRSASRSRSSRDSRKRNGSNEKRVRMSSSESRRAGQQGSQGLKIVTNNEGEKGDSIVRN